MSAGETKSSTMMVTMEWKEGECGTGSWVGVRIVGGVLGGWQEESGVEREVKGK
jgi:hypothetical protein